MEFGVGRHEHPQAALALNNLAAANIPDAILKQSTEDAVHNAAQKAPERQAQDQGSSLLDRPWRSAAQLAQGLIRAKGKEQHGGRDDDDTTEQAGSKTCERDASVGAVGYLSQPEAGDQSGLALREYAQLGAERVGRNAGIIGDDSNHQEVTAPGKAEASSVIGRREKRLLARPQLVRVQETENGRGKRVGKHLHMTARAFAAGVAARL